MSQLLFIFMEAEFIDLCKNDKLKEAKILYDKHNIDIHAYCDYAFISACRYGHLETAKRLYGLGADIHVHNDYAFRETCKNRHLKVIDWLLTIGDFDVKNILNSHSYAGKIDKLLKQHLEYKLKWCNLFGFNKKCTKKFSDIYDNSKKEYSKTFDDMFPFSKVKN